jgi:hypothetical protein
MRYKYHQLRNKLDPNDVLLVPVIPVGLRYRDKSVVVSALIDSGADLCLFHSSIGRALGIDIENGRKIMFKTLSPEEVPVYVHPIHLFLKGEPGIDLEIGFLERDLIADGGLLGQEGFFDHFDVRFQRWQNAIHIQRRKGWKKVR